MHPDSHQAVRQHLQTYFTGHTRREHVWTLGPALDVYPQLRIAEFAPGPKSNLWVYATIGGFEACCDPCLEFVLTAPEHDLRHVELLMMTAWYHGRRTLGTGHTFPIGEAWLPGSACDAFLVSFPYPFTESLELCHLPEGGHLHFRWLLPITPAERAFKVREGVEALEQRFESSELLYWEPGRSSVV